MKNIFQQFVAWATNSQPTEFDCAALKLTLYYVFSTFLLLVVFSVAVLFLYTPPEANPSFSDDIAEVESEEEHEEWSLYEFREHLVSVIVLIDLFILLLVIFFAYYAARRTLRPIHLNQERQLKFMGTVAHELRTPLTVMRTGGDAVLRKDRDVSEYKSYIKDVHEEAGRLTRLTNQLLQILRATQKEVTKENCNFSELVQKEVSKIIPYGTEHQVDLVTKIPKDIFIIANTDELIQVIQNLLKNAIDYNKLNGRVIVSLIPKNKNILLTVADTGIGIPADKKELIFNHFETLDSARSNSDESGMGLGLYVVKEILDKNKGDIEVTSVVGEGTTFTETLPCSHS